MDSTSDLNGELSVIERERIVKVLAECAGNKSLAARRLGIPRSTLFSKLVRLGLATK
jgi:transcriptional regulator of acetoin/glycerol metabolism